ncbi:MAG: bacillithiol biosynthesis deacetylase BshB1 [Acidobacteriota bacterium]
MSETVDVLAIGAHPDDVELACGGTLARLEASGRRVGIAHLTGGEAGTRGTAAERRREAEAAAEVLRAAHLDILDCGDGALRRGLTEEEQVMALLRRRRPDIVLGPPPADRHPDHGRAHELVAAAVFYAGLRSRSRGRGEAHRPGAFFHYMQHDLFEPRFIVDVSPVWERKVAALSAYRSQLHFGSQGGSEGDDGEERDEPMTKVATPAFSRAVEGRARHFGEVIGAEFGEPFGSRQALAVSDLFALLPGGVR